MVIFHLNIYTYTDLFKKLLYWYEGFTPTILKDLRKQRLHNKTFLINVDIAVRIIINISMSWIHDTFEFQYPNTLLIGSFHVLNEWKITHKRRAYPMLNDLVLFSMKIKLLKEFICEIFRYIFSVVLYESYIKDITTLAMTKTWTSIVSFTIVI